MVVVYQGFTRLMMEQSPYVFEESEGLMHIKLRADEKAQCRACVRKDAFEIIRQEFYAEGYRAAVRDAIAKVGGKDDEVRGAGVS